MELVSGFLGYKWCESCVLGVKTKGCGRLCLTIDLTEEKTLAVLVVRRNCLSVSLRTAFDCT